ncbi:peptidoglycan binding domain-containing protein, partial [Enterococcus faecium]|uniref:peptidoglycan binding domain-containing protein n=1 Tax=Enterococcus faecium TaxID=1352 RepID=UPI003CC6CE61
NEQNGWTWGMTYVSAAEKHEIDPVSQNHQKLDTTVQTLTTKQTDLNKDRTPTTDATIEKAGDSFVIKPEVNGNTIDVDAAVKQLK